MLHKRYDSTNREIVYLLPAHTLTSTLTKGVASCFPNVHANFESANNQNHTSVCERFSGILLIIIIIISFTIIVSFITINIINWLLGLVDSDNEDDFYRKLESQRVVWDEREKPFLGTNQNPSFSNFIYEKVPSWFQ